MLPLIQDLPEADEREFYRQMLARLLRVDERAFIGGQGHGEARRHDAGRRSGRAGPREQTIIPAPASHAPATQDGDCTCWRGSSADRS